ncbi:hypothetical protein NGA35_00520 [Pseudomonas stutzeri]|nr:hypothetical protein [Stutzerimonas stutzeri]
MPKLVADFVDDWIDHLTAEMRACWGEQIDNLCRADIPRHYFDSARRRVSAQPRELKLSDVFAPPVDPRTDWPAFAKKVREGYNLNPHLSTNHESLFNRDHLLNDWGIHHFHLNMHPHPKKPNFLDRTGPLVMGYVTATTFHAIGVYSHRPAPWSKVELIEILHRNWPDEIARFKQRGVSAVQQTEDQRTALRKKQYAQLSVVADGTAYGPLGGMHGFGTHSTSIEAIRLADRQKAQIAALQTDLERNLPQLLDKLKGRGYDGESDLKAKLVLADNRAMAYLPDYSLHVDIFYADHPHTKLLPPLNL